MVTSCTEAKETTMTTWIQLNTWPVYKAARYLAFLSRALFFWWNETDMGEADHQGGEISLQSNQGKERFICPICSTRGYSDGHSFIRCRTIEDDEDEEEEVEGAGQGSGEHDNESQQKTTCTWNGNYICLEWVGGSEKNSSYANEDTAVLLAEHHWIDYRNNLVTRRKRETISSATRSAEYNLAIQDTFTRSGH